MGIYLFFFHGRNTPEENLQDWGFQGPIIGPVTLTFSYGEMKLFDPQNTDNEEFKSIPQKEGLFIVEGKYYGEVEVWEENEPLLLEAIELADRKIISWDHLFTNINDLPEVKEMLEKYIIWNRSPIRGDMERCFVGSLEECEETFTELGYSNPNETIEQNIITDQWENEIEGLGYVTFASGQTISHPLYLTR